MKYMSEVIYLKNTFFTCSSMLKLLNVLARHMLVTQLCLTFCNSMDCSPPGSSVHGILQAKIVEWVAIPFSRGSSQTQGLNPGLLHCRWILYCLIYQGSPIER